MAAINKALDGWKALLRNVGFFKADGCAEFRMGDAGKDVVVIVGEFTLLLDS
jgi:hypothetical protein